MFTFGKMRICKKECTTVEMKRSCILFDFTSCIPAEVLLSFEPVSQSRKSRDPADYIDCAF
jgi:hypothetical protein